LYLRPQNRFVTPNAGISEYEIGARELIEPETSREAGVPQFVVRCQYLQPFLLAMRIPIESGDLSDQNRRATARQLDDGIADTFVSALLLISTCQKG